MKSARPGFLLVCLVAPLVAVKLREVKSEHPIQRVIRLVEELASKSVEEGKEEQLTYDKFVAWCEKSSKSLNKAIEKETEVSEKTSGKIEAKTLEKEQLTESIEALTKELSELEASATAAADDRAEQKKQHEQSVKDLKMTIESLGTAVTSLEASQVNQDVALLSKVMQIPLVLVALSQEEQALLEEAAAPKDYDFKTGGVTELLEKLKLDFEDKLSSAEKDGAKATQEYELAKGARDNAMKVATESKTKQEEVKAAVVSELSELDAKLTSTEKDLEEDTKSLSDTKTTCDTKAAEFKERVYMRGREQEAMKFGIQILQKATGVRTAKPASFIQIRSHGTFGTSAAQKAQALRLLQREVERSNNEDLRRLLLEVQSRLEGDGDVGKEVDAMLEKQLWKMREDQTTEDEKWQWCVAETKKTKKQKTNKEDDMEKLTNGIQSAQGSVTELQGEIKEATKRLSDLQKSSNEFKMDRQESKNEHQLALRDAKLAQEALSGAIGTLNKFYEEAAASLLQSVKPTDVAEAPETWSKGFSGTGQDGKGPGEAIIKVLEDCSADFAQMEAETKSQEVQEEADFDKEMIDAKKEKVRLQTEKSSKEEEEARLSEKIRDMSEKKKMTDRSVALLAKYHEDLSQKCNQTAYEARTAERKVSKVEPQKSQALLKEAFDASAETMLLRSKAHLSVLSSGSLAHRLGAAKRGSREAVSALHEKAGVPVPYSSFLIGKAMGKSIRLSIVALHSVDGVHQQFKELVKLAEELRRRWVLRQMSHATSEFAEEALKRAEEKAARDAQRRAEKERQAELKAEEELRLSEQRQKIKAEKAAAKARKVAEQKEDAERRREEREAAAKEREAEKAREEQETEALRVQERLAEQERLRKEEEAAKEVERQRRAAARKEEEERQKRMAEAAAKAQAVAPKEEESDAESSGSDLPLGFNSNLF